MTGLAFVLYVLGMYQTYCILAASDEQPATLPTILMLLFWPLEAAILLIGVSVGTLNDWWEGRGTGRGD